VREHTVQKKRLRRGWQLVTPSLIADKNDPGQLVSRQLIDALPRLADVFRRGHLILVTKSSPIVMPGR
jgi:hypothetical protein